MGRIVWVIRHGDRFDFEEGKEAWEVRDPVQLNDPVLSQLGRKQAVQTAEEVLEASARLGRPVERVITSPFVRCIETSNCIAELAGCDLLVDFSLFEVVYTTEQFPSLAERRRYFPRIDVNYDSLPRPAEDESFPTQAIARYAASAKALTERFPGQNLVLCSHAAGVSAIVASLLRVTVEEVGPVHPASLFCLEEAEEGAYKVVGDMCGSTRHFKQPLGKTLPWPRLGDCEEDTWGAMWIKTGNAENAPWTISASGGSDSKMPL